MPLDTHELLVPLPGGPESNSDEHIARHLPMSIYSTPEWFLNVSPQHLDELGVLTDGSLLVVLQQERCDGAELLTLRYPVVAVGRLWTYAGIGLNRAVYFSGSEFGSTVMNRRNRQRSLGGAVEFGVALPVTERVYVNADLRWIEIDRDAVVLRTEQGLAAADAVSVGLSLRWRFR
jgi:hypothetical protein